jgi:hypothetical protein
MKTSSSVDKDCWNAFELPLTKAKNSVECTIDATSIVGHHGGNAFIVAATAHASVKPWV